MSQNCISVFQYPDAVLAVDSGLFRDRMACCYLVEDQDEVAIIEAGGESGARRLLQTIDRRGLRPEQVRWVIVTHVHLDHAGGAGQLMQALPEATLLVHERGAKHMTDPSKLEAGARAVYGDEQYDAIYGSLVPIDPKRVRVMPDGGQVSLGAREFRFIDTPGHASHHFCVHDSRTNGWFSGDTFGLSYRELDTQNGPFIFPTTTPIDFNPDALRSSIEKLGSVDPDWMYLTHFGRIAYSPDLARRLIEGVNHFEQWGLEFENVPDRKQRISAAMTGWLLEAVKKHGVDLPRDRLIELLQPDVDLNTDGIDVWLRRRAKTLSSP
ncbi:MAG: MBL fold metallo-hydrolase [Gammaproteobacteria bacterium]|nr:MBL fold metallo-hydrolase [Gammaproteobacteria bacterium]